MTHYSPPRVPQGGATAYQYRCEAARLRGLADTSTFAEVRDDLTHIAREYEALAQQREDVARRYGG